MLLLLKKSNALAQGHKIALLEKEARIRALPQLREIREMKTSLPSGIRFKKTLVIKRKRKTYCQKILFQLDRTHWIVKSSH